MLSISKSERSPLEMRYQGYRLKDFNPLFRNSGPKEAHVRPGLTTHSALAFRYDILRAHTGCNLTYSSDRLVGLSGLAELFEEKTGDQYAAGLWNRISGVIRMDPIG